MAKTLIVYYSWSQTTKKLAQLIQKNSQADLIELTVKPGTFSSDMYQTSDIAQAQLKNNNLPELTNQFPDLSNYNLLLVGGPVWSGEVATPVRTFLKVISNFSGIVAPFYTSAGSDENYETNFRELYKGKVKTGLGLTAGDLNHDVPIKTWLHSLV